MLWVNIAVYKLVKRSKCMIQSMLICCNCELATRIAMSALNARIYATLYNFHFAKVWYTIVPILPMFFFVTVVIVNLKTWSDYYFKVGEMAKQISYTFPTKEEKRRIRN